MMDVNTRDLENPLLAATGHETEKKDDPAASVSFLQLFRYGGRGEVFAMIVGGLGAAVNGCALPLFSIILGNIFDDFQFTWDVLDAGEKYAWQFGMISLGIMFAAAAQIGCFTYAAETQAVTIRQRYFMNVLAQEMSWFDLNQPHELASSSLPTMLDAMGPKLGQFIQFVMMFLTGFVVAFQRSWEVSLVILAVVPFLAIGGVFMAKTLSTISKRTLEGYQNADALVDEALRMIKTVLALNLQNDVIDKYGQELTRTEQLGIHSALMQGLGFGFIFLIYFSSYGLTFWFGSKIVLRDERHAASLVPPDNATNPECFVGNVITPDMGLDLRCYHSDSSFGFASNADVCRCMGCHCGCSVTGDCMTGGTVLLCFFSLVMGSFGIGEALPFIASSIQAKCAAARLFHVVERKPKIDSGESSKQGRRDLQGINEIEFRDCMFAYPSRPESLILNQFNLRIIGGEKLGLVSGSGEGKSTLLALMMRFYNVTSGKLMINNVNIQDINVYWLRSQISYCPQDPILFSTSLRRNLITTTTSVSEQEIEEAIRMAGAVEVVDKLPNGIDTEITDQMLSRGEKQRITLARAILRKDASLFILDESTSALDAEMERIIQDQVEPFMTGRTVINVAHRLTTIQNSDRICVICGGQVVESGSHTQLLAKENGYYRSLVAMAQQHDANKLSLKEMMNIELSRRKRAGTMGKRTTTDSKHSGGAAVVTDAASPEQTASQVPLSRLFQFSKPESVHYVLAILGAGILGATKPLFSLIFSEIANVNYQPIEKDIENGAMRYAIYFTIFAFVMGTANFFMYYHFGLIGERMTSRIRIRLLKSILAQDMGFFDEPRNHSGSLSSALSHDAATIKANFVDRLQFVTQNAITIVVGLSLAFYNGHLLTLILLLLVPFMVVAGAMNMKIAFRMEQAEGKAMALVHELFAQSCRGIQTVQGLQFEDKLRQLHAEYLREPSSMTIRKGLVNGVSYGFSNGVNFSIYAVAFYAGSRLIYYHGYTAKQMINVFFAVVLTGFGIGKTSALMPDLAKAGSSVENVFRIIDRVSTIDSSSEKGLKAFPNNKEGEEHHSSFHLEGVSFAYPSNPDNAVISNLNMKMEVDSMNAITGPSGGCKSTILKLLLRFYDVNTGAVRMNGVDVRDLNVGFLRDQISYVDQDADLFSNATISENIIYGLPQTQRDIPLAVKLDMVTSAAKKAGAHDFIMGFPKQYDTIVGDGLSRGQRQRIVIARAFIRNAPIFIFDEATSSLDMGNEDKIKQELTELKKEHHTVIMVAHRLASIAIKGTMIFVADKGQIVEQGIQDELLRRPNSTFSRLYHAQEHM